MSRLKQHIYVRKLYDTGLKKSIELYKHCLGLYHYCGVGAYRSASGVYEWYVEPNTTSASGVW